jgi:hypothetical protein
MCNLTFGFIYPENAVAKDLLDTLRSAQSHCERSPAPCLPAPVPTEAGRQAQRNDYFIDIL